jgi:PAS domain S-box-containing protein
MKKIKRALSYKKSKLSSLRRRGVKKGVNKPKPSHDRSLFDSAALSFVETSLDGTIIDYNSALARMLLAGEEDFKGRKLSSLVSKKWQDKEEAESRILINSGHSDEYEIELCKRDGTILPVLIRKCLQTDKHGQPQSIWMLVRDIRNREHVNRVPLSEVAQARSSSIP